MVKGKFAAGAVGAAGWVRSGCGVEVVVVCYVLVDEVCDVFFL